jgi:hypothetical protein
MMRMIVSRSARIAPALAVAALCSACGSVDPGAMLSSLPMPSFGGGAPQTASTTPAAAPALPSDIDCPQVEVQDGTAAMRVGGDTNESVRYQFDIANVARECHIVGKQFSIKVGVAGSLLIGPAGKPGAYTAQLRIAVRRESDQKPAFSELYKVAADTAGRDQAPYQFVSEPIMLPFTRQQEDQDYTVLVGFDNGPVGRPAKPRHKKHTN